MSINGSNITINAAFLQEIKDNNLRLVEILKTLWKLCSVDDKRNLEPARFSELINKLRDLLEMHFTLEDTLGYLDDPLQIIPVLCKEAKRLNGQHVELYLEINAIADQAEESVHLQVNEIIYTKLIKRFRKFHEALLKHESEEYDLIMIAYYEDAGFNADSLFIS